MECPGCTLLAAEDARHRGDWACVSCSWPMGCCTRRSGCIVDILIPGRLDIVDKGLEHLPPHDMPSRTHIAARVTNQSFAAGAFLHLHPGPTLFGHQPLALVHIEDKPKVPSRKPITAPIPKNGSPGLQRQGSWMAPKRKKSCSSPRVRLGSFVPPYAVWEQCDIFGAW